MVLKEVLINILVIRYKQQMDTTYQLKDLGQIDKVLLDVKVIPYDFPIHILI